MRFMRQMAGKDEETSLEDSSFGPGHFILSKVLYYTFWQTLQKISSSQSKIHENAKNLYL